ncbi:glycosyltransferase family 2 protein [Intestinibacter bartlettii]|uniref:Glycosyltransferase n=1 Tax=Intestinibacter bartlettii TaxID=261299 RepID=A0ABS6DZP4_9FIRM|nr:glycosyltransferase family 2 protein [Intestinibacter bartlettii]MBU5337320.1 glycosyltransferase [Intestinibacter bartlettii]
MDISIIVPVYNTGKKLRKCIDSILNQTYKNFEVILINDGSTDNSLSICKEYKKKDNRIKIINQDNKGSVYARNSGVELAIGKYIVFIDADDWIDREFLNILYNEAEEYSCDIVACNPYLVYGNGLIKRIRTDFTQDIIFENEEIKNEVLSKLVGDTGFPSSLWGKIYKRNLFENYGEYFFRMKFFGEDLALNIELLPKCKKIKVIDKPLYYYRCGGGTTKYMKNLFEDTITTYCIQKDCIDKYYSNQKKERYAKISFIFLNTYKLVLVNMCSTGHDKYKIISKIENQVKDVNIRNAIENLNTTREWFEPEYIEALDNEDCRYLYNWGKKVYNKSKYKIFIKNMLVKLNI